jgi:acyl transferase domain-containing protein
MQIMQLQLHGTGTPLGDPIEVNGALAALRPKKTTQSQGPLLLAAHKASCGHAEPAAGMLGIAAALCTRSAVASPLLHLRFHLFSHHVLVPVFLSK